MKFGVLLLLVISSSLEARAGDRAFQNAMELLRRGNTTEAYAILESIPETAPDFTDALVELQKIHYRNQDWERFFAYAQFFRHRILAGTLTLRARMISLESFALAKHCQWETSQSVLNWALTETAIQSKAHDELLETKDYLRLHSSFPHEAIRSAQGNGIGTLFSRTKAWKIQAKRLDNIPHPKYLRLHLDSQCGGA